MRISATGISTNSPRAIGGFTLIEILVVLLIIGVLVAGTVLSIGVAGRDTSLDKERDRVAALMDYLRDQAALQNREYGMRCFVGGYEFLAYDARTGLWQSLPDDPMMRKRKLPTGIEMTLHIEGRPIVLPAADDRTENPPPQIMLFSSGDLNLFELTLRRAATGEGARLAPSASSDRIDVTPLSAATA
ncbi:MAG TPA: type II secretion system minor pseudopilin GspH [Steroidobacteraceae bacterium]|nr:type II secretion system minor pseudopilin GspH [Steroidobacteraceae bacterium]